MEKYKDLWEKEYTSDDILKILCALTARMMKEKNTNTANITETIFGSGLEFTINMKAKPYDGRKLQRKLNKEIRYGE